MSTFVNSEDPDEMQNNAAFHRSLHCLILFFTSQSTMFLLCRDGSSWVEPALSKD